MNRLWLKLTPCLVLAMALLACDSEGGSSLTGAAIGSQPFPFVTSISPNPAQPGQRIVIRGRNFGMDLSAVTVMFGGLQGAVVSVADDRIEANVPATLPAGSHAVRVIVAGRSSVASQLMIAPGTGGAGTGGGGSGTGGDGSGTGGDGSGTGGDGSGTGGDGSGTGGDGSGTGGDGSGTGGDGSGGGSGDQAADFSGTYDVTSGVASNSCPADLAVDAPLAVNEAVVTQEDSSVTTDMGGGLRFTDDNVTADGDFDASNGNQRLQQDFSRDAFTGTLTRDFGFCSVTFSLQGTKR